MPASDTGAVVGGYTGAWTKGDIKAARAHLADDVTFRGSIDRFDRADDFVVALGAFS